MKTLLFSILIFSTFFQSVPDAVTILGKVDANMSSRNRIVEATMIVHGSRTDRTMTSRTWSVGSNMAFTEYLSPAREAGTKMLKLEDQLWLYSPSTDRTIQISGHMLRQSVMGSDLSYEDMMEDRKLTDLYNASVTGEEIIEGRKVWVLDLKAKVEDVTYYARKTWIDQERFVPLREELYAKSGQLLKRTDLSDINQIQGRWFPLKVVFKDMLKEGKGTEYQITSIKFDQQIPDYIFTKAALKQ